MRLLRKPKQLALLCTKMTDILAKKKKKPFEDDNVIKECLDVAGSSFFNEFKSKTELCNAVMEVQVSQSTVTGDVECMSHETEQQPRQDLEICEFFSLLLGWSADVCDVLQLVLSDGLL
jgi:hypothetical protein